MLRQKHNIVDFSEDGYHSELVTRAIFDGVSEIPVIKRPECVEIPDSLIPFSMRDRTTGHTEMLHFYEHDVRFLDALYEADQSFDELSRFKGLITPDPSLNWDMPLILQGVNVYMNRAYGAFFQSRGVYVIPNIRWGDKRTYTTCEWPEKVAFLGVEKHSIVAVGSYGCLKDREKRYHFQAGLEAMLDELMPEIVIVYGSTPRQIFGAYERYTRFIQIDDWRTSIRKRRSS